MFKFCSLLFVVIAVNSTPTKNDNLFKLHVVHVNDFHARFEQTNNNGGSCKDDNCIGGFSRLYEQVTELRKQNPDLVLLNAGDNFQGTLWYTVHRWNVTQYFMNKLNFDAITLGNHEFDDGIDGVTPFIKALNTKVIVSNIDDSLEPTFQGLYTKSTIIERNGKKIGIIGVITRTTSSISSPGNLKFLDESASVNAEAERLVNEEKVFTVIVLSHSGYDVEQAIAANATEKIALVVGGHSHTFLYTGEPTPGPDKVQGPYPTIVKRKDGKSVLVTQASAYCKYYGNITITYDSNGEFVDYQGNPIFLETSIPQDAEINDEMIPWKEKVDKMGTKVLGSTIVTLSNDGCYNKECLLGNFVTDAYVYSYINRAENGSWTYAAIAITNAGSLRTNIEAGNITYNDLLTAQPFGNTVDVSEIEGQYIKELLETAASTEYYFGRIYASIKLIQVSGIKYKVDLNQPEGSRIQSIKIRCNECLTPVYNDIDVTKLYRIITPSFMTGGGDGFDILPQHLKNTVIGQNDIDVLSDYLSKKSPVYEEIEDRIDIIGSEKIEMKNME